MTQTERLTMERQTFVPAIAPKSISTKTTVRTLSNSFGDGYQQTVADGLNAVSESLDLTWEGLTWKEAEAYRDFLTENQGQSFWWGHPVTGKKKLWRCVEWNETASGRYITLTATFTEVFA